MVTKKLYNITLVMLLSAQGALYAPPHDDSDDLSMLESEQNNLLIKGFGINFHRGMRSCPSYSQDVTFKDADWHLVKFLYDAHIADFDNGDSKTVRIPHTIHQIWLGEGALPEGYKALQESWKHQHANWQYKLWTAQDIASLDLINKAAYEAAATVEEKTAIAQCEILYRFGGIFVALDCECFKSFDPLHRACDFYAGLTPADHVLISDNIIGAAPGNSIIGICIEAVRRMSLKQDSFSPQNFRNALTAAYKSFVLFSDERSVILPLSYLDPWPLTEDNVPDRSRRRFSTKMSFAMKHWYLNSFRKISFKYQPHAQESTKGEAQTKKETKAQNNKK